MHGAFSRAVSGRYSPPLRNGRLWRRRSLPCVFAHRFKHRRHHQVRPCLWRYNAQIRQDELDALDASSLRTPAFAGQCGIKHSAFAACLAGRNRGTHRAESSPTCPVFMLAEFSSAEGVALEVRLQGGAAARVACAAQIRQLAELLRHALLQWRPQGIRRVRIMRYAQVFPYPLRDGVQPPRTRSAQWLGLPLHPPRLPRVLEDTCVFPRSDSQCSSPPAASRFSWKGLSSSRRATILSPGKLFSCPLHAPGDKDRSY